MESLIDLRSDTVTKPSPGMRRAMAGAEVGDDVYGEDPSTNRLQEKVAELFGKEAALFVPSGTMANQVAVKAQTTPGGEIIVESHAHIYRAEAGALAAVSGVQVQLVPGVNGVISVEQVAGVMRTANVHYPPTQLICLENTHNSGGGKVYPLDVLRQFSAFSRECGVPLHLDGARVLNAAVAGACSPQDIAENFSSLTLCFSKGLGAPVGSVVVGSKDFIAECLPIRKRMGGGMRQIGILAAAAGYALENNVDRLADDHQNAQRLARALAEQPGLRVDLDAVETNIIFVDVEDPVWTPALLVTRFREAGVLMNAAGPHSLRALTHLDVSKRQIEQAIDRISRVCRRPVGSAVAEVRV